VIHGERIQRLEALLERVRARSSEARRPASDGTNEVELAAARAETLDVASVTAAPESPASGEHDSRERLVAADPVEADIPHADETARVQESMAPIDVAEIEVAVEEEHGGESDSEDERAPVSSRRPVAPDAEERLAQIAFGSEEPLPPLHTPPPESGRLPAATGSQFDQDPDFTGVRNATPLLPRRMEGFSREIAPETLRPQLAPSDTVAEVIAEAQRFAPSTFVALLDASLSL
jgi:hypothetical protein